MENLTLSIIIPVYNVEKYLAKCLDSILKNNTFTGQLICVNDGSTDGSAAILEEYKKQYPNVEVISQSNSGLSAARNAGIMAATGEYICLLDSDDFWEPNVLRGLMGQVEREELDILRFDYQNVKIVNSKYEVFQPYKNPHSIDFSHEVVSGEDYLNTRMSYTCYAVMYIIKKKLVPQFTEGIHFEDVDWLPRMMLNAKRVNSTQTVVYSYFWRQGSITQTQGNKDKIKKNIEDEMYIIEQYSKYRAQYPLCRWLYNMQSTIAAGVLTTVALEFYTERKEYISRLRKMMVFPLAVANQGKTYARRARSINLLGPSMYCKIMRLRAMCKL